MRIQLAQILLLDVGQFYLLVFKIINYTDVYEDKCKNSRISKLVDVCAKLNREKMSFHSNIIFNSWNEHQWKTVSAKGNKVRYWTL